MRKTLILALSCALITAGSAVAAPTKKVTGAEDYLALPHMSASIIDGPRISGLLQIDAGLDIKDGKLRQRAEQMMPRLRNAYNDALTVYASKMHRPGGVPDADRIAALLQSATNQVLGQEGATLLLSNVLIHDQ